MISCVEIKCNAAHPDLPLAPLVAFVNSPSSIRILDVPKKIGEWVITRVYVQVTYPNQVVKSKSCVRTGNVWVATFDGCNISGKSEKGYQILADGTDEDGNAVTGYVLGVGDAIILECDGAITPGTETVLLHLVEDTENPRKGDAYIHDNSLSVYDGTQWNSTGSSIIPSSQNPTWAEHAMHSNSSLHASESDNAHFAESAGDALNASFAVRAECDEQGNTIHSTYATKTEVPSKVSELENDSKFIGVNTIDNVDYVQIGDEYHVTQMTIGGYENATLTIGDGSINFKQQGSSFSGQIGSFTTSSSGVYFDGVKLATMQYVDEQIGNVLQEAF